MDVNQQIWQAWATRLHRWGVKEIAASLLEAAGPLTILGAQLVYLGEPMLRGILPENQLGSLAGLLEDTDARRAFAQYLREDNSG